MSLPGIQALIARKEFGRAKYIVRAAIFLVRSRFQSHFLVALSGSAYHLRGNSAKLGIDGYLYVFRDEYEPEIRDCLLDYFRDGWLFIDIGANSGCWSRFIAHRFGASRIIAFEPTKATFGRLCQNLASYSDRARTRNAAVSDAEQLAYLASESDPGSNHLVAAPGGSTEQVAVVTLDREWKRDNWLMESAGRCMIKIDVEGFELHALNGAREFLRASRPIVLFEFVERHLARAGSTPEDLFAFWAEEGYSIFSLEHDGKSVRYSKAADVGDMLAHPGNFVAVHD